jgi:hypothetical protein
MFTFDIITVHNVQVTPNDEKLSFDSKEEAVSVTNFLEDYNIAHKIVVTTPNKTKHTFSGLNAWTEITEFFNL